MCVHWIPLFYHKTDDDVNDDDDDSASSWLSWWHPFFSFIILFSIILSISQFWEALKRTIALYTHTQLLRAQAPENQSHCLFVSTVLVCVYVCMCMCVCSFNSRLLHQQSCGCGCCLLSIECLWSASTADDDDAADDDGKLWKALFQSTAALFP